MGVIEGAEIEGIYCTFKQTWLQSVRMLVQQEAQMSQGDNREHLVSTPILTYMGQPTVARTLPGTAGSVHLTVEMFE